MSEYTPTTEDVREAYATRNAPVQDDARRAQFDRWLAEHDAALVEKLADEFQSRLPDGTGNGRAYNSHTVAGILRARAAEIREGTK